MSELKPCPHDYVRPIRKGRCHYVCPLCGADISLEVIMIAEAEFEDDDRRTPQKER